MSQRFIPGNIKSALTKWRDFKAGRGFADRFVRRAQLSATQSDNNDLRRFFRDRKTGPGIWKWDHYFDIYDRHLKKFRNKPVCIVEIGIYSGGSLDMWQAYFGREARIIGVDIEPACKRYERPGVEVFIGDQADRDFWARFRSEVPNIDIVIDDGGHKSQQQIVTMEELVPHLNPGGAYICEDVHGSDNSFIQYIFGLASRLNCMDGFHDAPDDPERRLSVRANNLQGAIESIAFYPFVVALETRNQNMAELVAPKHGTQWEPFLS
jgi:cephalosporin hydroxylase